jgi:surface antigen
MYKYMLLSAVLICHVTLIGCASHQVPSRQTQGTVVGGVIGGVLGSQVGGGSGKVIATVAGTLIGALVGSHVGGELDELDRYKTGQTLETARTGVSEEWVNPDSGAGYKVTPTRTYESDYGTPCREFIMDSKISGKSEQVYGTACRQNDGSWRMTT